MEKIVLIVGHFWGCEIYYWADNEMRKVMTERKAFAVIEKMLFFYNKTFEGNVKQISKKFGFTQKVPIFMEENRYLFFPTLSAKDPQCCWVNYYCVEKMKRHGKETILDFMDRRLFDPAKIETYSIELPFDIRVIKKQMKRCKEIHDNYVNERISIHYLIH